MITSQFYSSLKNVLATSGSGKIFFKGTNTAQGIKLGVSTNALAKTNTPSDVSQSTYYTDTTDTKTVSATGNIIAISRDFPNTNSGATDQIITESFIQYGEDTASSTKLMQRETFLPIIVFDTQTAANNAVSALVYDIDKNNIFYAKDTKKYYLYNTGAQVWTTAEGIKNALGSYPYLSIAANANCSYTTYLNLSPTGSNIKVVLANFKNALMYIFNGVMSTLQMADDTTLNKTDLPLALQDYNWQKILNVSAASDQLFGLVALLPNATDLTSVISDGATITYGAMSVTATTDGVILSRQITNKTSNQLSIGSFLVTSIGNNITSNVPDPTLLTITGNSNLITNYKKTIGLFTVDGIVLEPKQVATISVTIK